jgi:hypothetical protein
MKDKVGWTTQKGAHELRKLYGAQIKPQATGSMSQSDSSGTV